MNKYTVFYNTGCSEVITGTTYEKAKLRHGIYKDAEENIVMSTDGSLRDKYKWNPETKRWTAKPKVVKY